MSVIFLPTVERELRLAARRRGTYWSRSLAALSALLILVGTLWFEGQVAPKDLGKDVFNVLSGLFLLNSLVAGIRYTADCLSEEKREGTLGLLFLTDLRGHDVVLGKLAATSLDAFYGLIAIFPVLAIPLLLGGVTLGEFWRMTLVLANTLLFSLATGIFVSAISRDARKAMAWTFILILLINGAIPGVGVWLAFNQATPVNQALLLPSAWHAWWLAFDTPYAVNPTAFRWSILFTHGLAWSFLALASLAARKSWQDRPAGAWRSRWRQCWQRWSYGNAAERAAFRARLLNISPCFWLGGRHRLKPVLVWAFLGLSGGVWLWGALKWREDWLQAGTYFATALLLHGALKLWVTSEACLRFGPDHRSGALELLLSTPLTVAEIVRGQMLALRRQFMWPILLVVGLDFVFMLAGAAHPGSGGDDAWVWICWAGMTTLVADVYTLCWVGMWIGLTDRRANRATGATVARVLVLPCGACFGLVLLMSFTGLWHRVEDTWTFYLGLWFAVGMIVDLHFGIQARQRLLRDLRTVATQRFVPRRRFLAMLTPRRSQSSPALPPAIVGET
jgi:ABC-type transport system involved in cytochrome c biogenesis permease component